MKHTFIAMALAFGTLAISQAATLPFPDVPTSKQMAKEQGKPLLVIWHGSDWMPGSDKLCEGWKKLAAKNLPVVLGQYDDCLGQKGDARNKMLPIECYNLPVAVLMAPDGTFMRVFPVETTKSYIDLAEGVQKTLAVLQPFTALAKEARESTGVAAATAAGKALDLIPMDSALRHEEFKKLINKQDPGDESGYRALYAMGHMDMFKEINLLLKEKDGVKNETPDYDAAEKYVLKRLDNTKLKGERLQQWLAGLYYIQKERALSQEKPDLKPVLETLRKIVEIDATTMTGQGAAKFYDYWNPDSFYTIRDLRYDAAQQTYRFEKEWHVDVTSCMQGAGEYTFSLLPVYNGPMVTRDFRLVVDGKEVAKANGVDAKANTKSVGFTVPALPKDATVEVWLRAQCNDGWLGCSGNIEMKKK